MKVLALELSTSSGSLAWLEIEEPVAGGNERREAVGEWPNDRKNSGAFFEHMARFREKFGLPDRIIVGLGPGSYTGTRTAISAGVGLQTASNASLIGFPSICAIECDANEYCVIGDARRQSFFFARIHANSLVEGPILYAEAELKMRLAGVDKSLPLFACEELPQFEKAAFGYPSALILARLAHDSGRHFMLPPLEPIYLYEPYFTVSRKPIAL